MPYRLEAMGFDGSLYLPLAGGTMTGSILVNGNIDLGSLASPWRVVYASTLEVGNGGVVGSAAGGVTMLQPAATLNGFNWVHIGGLGGVANASTKGGNGGSVASTAGRGGPSSATHAAGNGADFSIDAGDAGDNALGGGAGTAGVLRLGTQFANSVEIGRGSATTRINGTFRYDNASGTVSATVGGTATPSNCVSFLVVNVGGTLFHVPYYNP